MPRAASGVLASPLVRPGVEITMATITAKSLITIAQTLLQDATSVRWPRAELLGYLNDGQRETVLLKPEACVTNAAALLTADETMQRSEEHTSELQSLMRISYAAF